MTDTSIDLDTLDVATLPSAAITTLGDSALGHAVRRALERDDMRSDNTALDPIAAHDSHV